LLTASDDGQIKIYDVYKQKFSILFCIEPYV